MARGASSTRTRNSAPAARGGADLAGLIEAIAGREPPAPREQAFRELLGLLRLPGASTLERFWRAGFPVAFVQRGTALAKEAFGSVTPVFTGIQAWGTPSGLPPGPRSRPWHRWALDEIGRIVSR